MPCPVCAGAPQLFHQLASVPVHSVRLFGDQAAARAIARGSIELVFCGECGLVWNRAFDPKQLAYRADYHPSQACSQTFNDFHRRLAQRLLADWQLPHGEVLEVGCGDGEFLALLCGSGPLRGVGYDPACRREDSGRVRVERRHFRRGMCSARFEAVVCKMTLEHISEPAGFVSALAEAAKPQAPVFLMVPDARRILSEGAFEDVYYEHCNYFLPDALQRLCARAGLCVEQMWCAYGEQYLLASARHAPAPPRASPPSGVADQVACFAARCAAKVAHWQARLADSPGPRVLWGGGSKAVAFLSMLGEQAAAAAVDIDPAKQGGFLPGSGVPIVAPQSLVALRPGLVIVMNGVYLAEIKAELARLGVRAEVEAL